MAQTQADPYRLAITQLNIFIDQLHALRAQLDPTQFDVRDLADHLAAEDATTIVDWVRSNIGFEQYPGVLRGSQGTLVSRAGNALDQSILLVELLQAAGFDTQIVRSHLPAEYARTLVHQMFAPQVPSTLAADLQDLEGSVREMTDALNMDLEALLAHLGASDAEQSAEAAEAYDLAERDAQMIIDTLALAGVQLGDPEIEAQLTVEAQDYFWVQYRRGEDSWKDAHPLFLDPSDSPQELPVLEVFHESVPEHLVHRLRFQVFIEQHSDGILATHAVTPSWERPIAELVG